MASRSRICPGENAQLSSSSCLQTQSSMRSLSGQRSLPFCNITVKLRNIFSFCETVCCCFSLFIYGSCVFSCSANWSLWGSQVCRIPSLPLTREVDFAKQKTEGETAKARTSGVSLPQSRIRRDSSLVRGSLVYCTAISPTNSNLNTYAKERTAKRYALFVRIDYALVTASRVQPLSNSTVPL